MGEMLTEPPALCGLEWTHALVTGEWVAAEFGSLIYPGRDPAGRAA